MSQVQIRIVWENDIMIYPLGENRRLRLLEFQSMNGTARTSLASALPPVSFSGLAVYHSDLTIDQETIPEKGWFCSLLHQNLIFTLCSILGSQMSFASKAVYVVSQSLMQTEFLR